MATRVLLSVFNAGWAIKVKGRTVESSQVKSYGGTNPNLDVLRSLIAGLGRAKVMCDHGTLVIELDNSFVHRGLVEEDGKLPEFNKAAEVIDLCDAKVQFKLVDKAQARLAVKHGVSKRAKVETEDIASAFADLD